MKLLCAHASRQIATVLCVAGWASYALFGVPHNLFVWMLATATLLILYTHLHERYDAARRASFDEGYNAGLRHSDHLDNPTRPHDR